MFGKQTRICELYKDDACVSGPTKHSWFDCSGMIYDYHMVELCRNCCARIYARCLVVRVLIQAASCTLFCSEFVWGLGDLRKPRAKGPGRDASVAWILEMAARIPGSLGSGGHAPTPQEPRAGLPPRMPNGLPRGPARPPPRRQAAYLSPARAPRAWRGGGR